MLPPASPVPSGLPRSPAGFPRSSSALNLAARSGTRTQGASEHGAKSAPGPLAPPLLSLGRSPPAHNRHFLSSSGRVRSVQRGGPGSALVLVLIWPSEPSRARWFGPRWMGRYQLRTAGTSTAGTQPVDALERLPGQRCSRPRPSAPAGEGAFGASGSSGCRRGAGSFPVKGIPSDALGITVPWPSPPVVGSLPGHGAPLDPGLGAEGLAPARGSSEPAFCLS